MEWWQWFLLVPTVLVCVWLIARVACAAYFRAKAHYMKEFFRESGEEKRPGSAG